MKRTFAARLRAHIRIMRLYHSLKNIFVIPGIVVPLKLCISNAPINRYSGSHGLATISSKLVGLAAGLK